ncbi:hypothetical protein FRB96_000379 [Tulasnella sp. 330]|nr:hypothetical protein FRB96_000379 [Tulasnella sp. 330]KAG8884990.1 hypothetical protein FRB97_002497 [Tulasnella sp. 331]
MNRTISPGPSIASSFDSVTPSLWMNIDPLELTQGATSLSNTGTQVRDMTETQSYHRAMASNTRQPVESQNSRAPDDLRKSTKKGRGSVFSRVFKSGDNSQSFLPMAPARHGRSSLDSMEPLNPLDTSLAATKMVGSLSLPPRSKNHGPAVLLNRPDRSSLPPTTSGGSNLTSPVSQTKSNRSRRPKSLNIVSSGSRKPASPLPPTVNTLAPETRSDLMRKNRKLQQMLGTEFSHNSIPALPSHRSVKSMDTSLSDHPTVSSMELSTSEPGSLSSWGQEYSNSKASVSVLSMAEALTTQKGQSVESEVHTVDRSRRMERSTSAFLSPLPLIPGTPGSFMDLSDGARTPISPTTPNNLPGINPFEESPEDDNTCARTLNVSPDSRDNEVHDMEEEPAESLTGSIDTRGTPRAPVALLSPDAPSGSGSTSRTGRSHLRSSTLIRSSSTPPVSPSSGLFPSAASLHPYAHGGRSYSAESFQTFLTADAMEEDAAERKRRRDKLAKLHRYLGSNVPAGLVLGGEVEPLDNCLPEASPLERTRTSEDGNEEGVGKGGKWWKGLQKSASVPASSQDRRQESEPVVTARPLSEQDRVLNVKRKTKMEQMFGSNPPQDLYALRGSNSASPLLESAPGGPSPDEKDDNITAICHQRHDSTLLKSLEFMRHSHSLNSLKYLVENDDKESLRNLFKEMTREDPLEDLDEEITFAPPEDEDDDEDDASGIAGAHLNPYGRLDSSLRSASSGQTSILRQSYAKSSLSPILDTESRSPTSRGFPVLRSPTLPRSPSEAHHLNTASQLGRRTSASSLFSLTLEAAPVDPFQQRRKQAAKLTKFFGTDYRSIFGEVLESIEVGVLDDQTRGTLSNEEAAELLRKLHKIKFKPPGIKHVSR